jgi:hypothetical protein
VVVVGATVARHGIPVPEDHQNRALYLMQLSVGHAEAPLHRLVVFDIVQLRA